MNSIRWINALLTIFVFAVICTFAQDTAVSTTSTPTDPVVGSDDPINNRYRIGFQDVLSIQVFKHPDLTQTVPVSPNGTISVFRINEPIVAACKTERELAAELADAYKKTFIRDPQVTVVVADQKSQSVAVMGAVEKPGNIYVNHRIHLLELLALAGGPSKEAGTRLVVARTGSTSNCRDNSDPKDSDDIAVVGFKLRDIQEGKKTFWMQPGDVVTVAPADLIYVYGNVNKQAVFPVREPITLTQAIVTAEGLKPAANKDKIRVLRQRDGSAEREELIFDLNQINKGKVKDPYLEPNDIVAVSEDKAKSILLGFANSIKNSVPNVLYRFP